VWGEEGSSSLNRLRLGGFWASDGDVREALGSGIWAVGYSRVILQGKGLQLLIDLDYYDRHGAEREVPLGSETAFIEGSRKSLSLALRAIWRLPREHGPRFYYGVGGGLHRIEDRSTGSVEGGPPGPASGLGRTRARGLGDPPDGVTGSFEESEDKILPGVCLIGGIEFGQHWFSEVRYDVILGSVSGSRADGLFMAFGIRF